MAGEIARRILELRRGGISFDEIAERLNLNVEHVIEYYDDAVSADVHFDPILEVERLDRLLSSAWPKARAGDPKMMELVLKISERREHLSRPEQFEHRMREAFDASACEAQNLHPGLDSALLEAGRTIADRIDAAQATGQGQEVTKALYLMPHLMNVLREMLATPAARRESGKGVAPDAGQGEGEGGSRRGTLKALKSAETNRAAGARKRSA